MLIVLLLWFTVVIGFMEYHHPEVFPKAVEGDGYSRLSLQDLSAFDPTTANWQIVGRATVDTLVDMSLQGYPGTGVLANIMDRQNRGHLFTHCEHADIEIDLEVMMAKGSNSGIYLQGRYEVQLLDSWGKEGTKYSYMGGIYQRSDPATGKGFEGSAPAVNACGPPGTWQQLRVVFKAPRFDTNGAKTANATFLKVYLNGKLIQEGVEVSGPTRSAAFEDERPYGPLMIQGNHGPAAFKNIRYKINSN